MQLQEVLFRVETAFAGFFSFCELKFFALATPMTGAGGPREWGESYYTLMHRLMRTPINIAFSSFEICVVLDYSILVCVD